LVHRSVEISSAPRMMNPPIDGVPALPRWRSGVSSRMVSPPSWTARSRRISHGPSMKEITVAVTVAIAARNVMYRKTLKMMLSLASGTRRS
jgi:hypothetical protein